MRKWKNYRHKNVIGQDCHLITVVNAYYYLTGNIIDDQLYDEFVDMSGCRYGSVIRIKPVLDKLGIKTEKHDILFCELNNVKKLLPLNIVVWHPIYGFHSILAVDYEKKTNSYRVLNFNRETTSDGWIYGEKLQVFSYACEKHIRKIESYRNK